MSEMIANKNLSVMSFNILYNQVTDERVARVVKTIAKAHPDTIGVQECTPKWLAFLCDLLPKEYTWVKSIDRNDNGKGEYSAIFYRNDVLELLETDTKWLSDTPDICSKYEQSSLNRVVCYAVFKNKQSGTVFIHANTHLDNIGAQGEQATALCKVVDAVSQKYGNCPIFVTGDFNQIVTAPGHTAMLNDGFLESNGVAIVRENPEKTFDPEEIYAPGKFFTIDYCFVKHIDAEQIKLYRVITEKVDGAYPSDHYPVYFEFDMTQGNA